MFKYTSVVFCHNLVCSEIHCPCPCCMMKTGIPLISAGSKVKSLAVCCQFKDSQCAESSVRGTLNSQRHRPVQHSSNTLSSWFESRRWHSIGEVKGMSDRIMCRHKASFSIALNFILLYNDGIASFSHSGTDKAVQRNKLTLIMVNAFTKLL